MFKWFNPSGRDAQRRRLYKAERAAELKFQHPGDDVSTPERYAAKVAEIMASEWMRTNYPDAVKAGPVSVRFNPRKGGACAGFHGITTGTNRWVMSMLILCHELGHTITRRTYKTHRVLGRDLQEYRWSYEADARGVSSAAHRIAGHGPEYAAVYLQLVRQFIGYEQWKLLRAEFDAARVRYGDPFAEAQRTAAPRLSLSFATPSKPRNSNPSLSAKVLVNGVLYQSMWVAYQQLLPGASASHMQRNRIELKKTGRVTVVWNEQRFEFVGVPK